MESLIYKDYTIKAVVADFKQIENLLQELKATFAGVDHQTDTYFQVSIGKLKLRQGTIENLITHYERKTDNGMEKTTVYQYDVNPSSEQITSLFNSHAVIGVIKKDRMIYFIDNIKIHLDTIQEMKQFIEIEAIDRSNVFTGEALRAQCLDIKKKLGINDSDLIKTGYLTS
ncbi:MAG: class IV adenylate cyclase [Sediminibacterium sp.]